MPISWTRRLAVRAVETGLEVLEILEVRVAVSGEARGLDGRVGQAIDGILAGRSRRPAGGSQRQAR